MRKLILSIILTISFILYSASFACPVEAYTDYELHFHMEYGKVLVEHLFNFEDANSTGQVLEMALPADARSVTARVDGALTDVVIDGNLLILPVGDTSSMEIRYITEEYVESDKFIANVLMPLDVDKLTVILSLPENTLLAKPLGSGADTVFPKPISLETDGRFMDVVWVDEALEKGEAISFFTRYVEPAKLNFVLLSLMLFLFIAALAFVGYKMKRGDAVKSDERLSDKTEKKADRQDSVSEHLKEEENQIVNILHDREGSCEQGTLRVITGFSKASLSRLLQELEDRKIVKKEKRGKKNLVFLR